MTVYEIRNLYKGKVKTGEGERRDKEKISEKKRRHIQDTSVLKLEAH